MVERRNASSRHLSTRRLVSMMRCPRLEELPTPPAGKTGWPWTEECAPLSAKQDDGSPWPTISIVTPSFNQARFFEATVRSVLLQGYPSLEYIIIDGGSRDDSVEIIKRYERWIFHWVSETDRGQSDAINKGLKVASGDWVAWQNSDDVYFKEVLKSFAEATSRHPRADLIIGNMMLIDESDRSIRELCYVKPTYRALLAEGMVLTNQAAFWRRSMHDRLGWLNADLDFSFDYEWFLRLTRHVKTAHVNAIWGGLRIHGETKTNRDWEKSHQYHNALKQRYVLPRWLVAVYKVRRMFLLLAQGKILYVFRGILFRLLRRKRDIHRHLASRDS